MLFVGQLYSRVLPRRGVVAPRRARLWKDERVWLPLLSCWEAPTRRLCVGLNTLGPHLFARRVLSFQGTPRGGAEYVLSSPLDPISRAFSIANAKPELRSFHSKTSSANSSKRISSSNVRRT